MIHYIGRLQKTPGRRACGSVTGQADSHDLAATDCQDCKASLVGLTVVHAQPGSVAAPIAEAHPAQVGLSHFGDDRMWMPWRQLDIPNPWKVAEQ